MSVQVSKVTNGNIYLNGGSAFGQFEEVTLPTLTQVMAEHKALGMRGKLAFPTGLEQMEASIKWNSLYDGALALSANPFAAVSLMVRSSRENWDAAGGLLSRDAVYAVLEGTFKEAPGIGWKPMDNVDVTSKMMISAYGFYVNGLELFYVNVKNTIHRVNGVDLLAQYRAQLGI